MSYRDMSNREGNQQRIMEMHNAKMPQPVIAAYMTHWGVPMTTPDVQGIINTYKPMGERAVKKTDVEMAIKTHQQVKIICAPIEENNDGDLIATTKITAAC